MSNGWVCPKCGRVYAPFKQECTHCNNSPIITPKIPKEFPPPCGPYRDPIDNPEFIPDKTRWVNCGTGPVTSKELL